MYFTCYFKKKQGNEIDKQGITLLNIQGMALKVWCRIVFLYNLNMHVWNRKEGDGYRFRCLLKQVEIDVQSTSNRKLPNFYEKVTDFLSESYRISKWWQNGVLTEAWRDCHNQRVLTYYTTGYLYRLCVCLCIFVACLCCLI